MAWHYFFDQATGRLLSEADGDFPQHLLDPFPPGLGERVRPGRVSDTEMWDDARRDFVPRPPKVYVQRFDDLLNEPRYSSFRAAYDSLNPARQNMIRDAFNELLGPLRRRGAGQPTAIGE